MKTDDDQPHDDDPWADLDTGDSDAEGNASAEPNFVFAFDGLEGETPAGQDSPGDASRTPGFPDDGEPDDAEEGPAPTVQPFFSVEKSTETDAGDAEEKPIPLTVFPPIGGDAVGSDIQIGTGRSGIIAMSDVIGDPPSGENTEAGALDFDRSPVGAEQFDDEQIAAELGSIDDESGAIDAFGSGGIPNVSDFGEPRADLQGDDVSFDTGAGGDFPFADAEPFASPADLSWEAGGVAESVAAAPDPAAALPAVVGAVAAPAARKSGLGQAIGVVSGGLLAIPVTYALLLWGFHKDPLRIAKQLPAPVAALLPHQVRGAADRGGRPARKGVEEVASQLDSLASVTTETPTVAVDPTDEPIPEPRVVADETTTAPDTDDAIGAAVTEDSPAPMPMKQSAATDPGTTDEPADSTVSDAADPVAAAVVPPADPAMRADPTDPTAPTEPTEPTEPTDPTDPTEQSPEFVPSAIAASPVVTEQPPMVDAVAIAGLPAADALSALDAVVPPLPAADVTDSARVAMEPPPLDLSALDDAAERATRAFDAVGDAAEDETDSRDRLLVTWYRRLARLAEELVALETVAAESGRPLREMPASAAGLLERIGSDDAAIADVERLGRMWLGTRTRRADGVALVGMFQGTRQVGPYWSTRVMIRGGREDGGDRSLSIVSRTPPAAETDGEAVLITGILFDGDAVWASDLRPIAALAHETAGEESAGEPGEGS